MWMKREQRLNLMSHKKKLVLWTWKWLLRSNILFNIYILKVILNIKLLLFFIIFFYKLYIIFLIKYDSNQEVKINITSNLLIRLEIQFFTFFFMSHKTI